MRRRTTILLLCLSLSTLASTLAACSDQHSPPAEGRRASDTGKVLANATMDADPGSVSTVEVAPTPVGQGPTRGGDGLQVELRPLTAHQLDSADVPGELACSFADASNATLLVARADVLPDAPVQGVVNRNGFVETIGNARAGGFNDLLDGITLTGKGLTLLVVRGAAQPTGDETTRHAATVTVQRADGAERRYEGALTCGP